MDLLKRFFDWYQYQSSLSMLDIAPKDEILLTLVNIIFLVSTSCLAGWIAYKIEERHNHN